MEKIRSKVLVSERLVLKPIEETSKDELLEIVTNQEVKKTYMLPDFKDKEEKDAFFLRLKAISENLVRFVYGIYLEDHLIGFINEVEKDDTTIEIGYFISPKYWNHGYATEALQVSIKELFKIGYFTVKAAHFKENKASGRVMQKCGMKLSGEESELEYRGKRERCVYYQIDKRGITI